ncbi:hypothetical protein [Serinicoccus sediminis]|uniref:hypothetical protein n=1 Tax=Serinicoccus sediminis TaxID=2306021 RepID=UPI0010204B21|nr:hypothetical protein [Serinicoccus sediminis]
MVELLRTVLPLALLGAVSPLIFATSSALLTGQGRAASARYGLGGALVLSLVVALGAGLLGAGLTTVVERDLASRVVDGTLGALLLLYAGYLVVKVRRAERPTQSSGSARAQNPLVLGVTAMATNLTTLPLMLSAGQHVGAARLPLPETVPLLVVLVLLALAPAWLPLVLVRVAPRLLEHRRHGGEQSTLSRLLPVLACAAGAVLLLGRALHLFS